MNETHENTGEENENDDEENENYDHQRAFSIGLITHVTL